MNNTLVESNRSARFNTNRNETSKIQNGAGKAASIGSSQLVGNAFDASQITSVLDKLNGNQQRPWESGDGAKPLYGDCIKDCIKPSGGLIDIIKPGIELPVKPFPFPIKPIGPQPEVELADPGLTAEHDAFNNDGNAATDIEYRDIDGEIVVGGIDMNVGGVDIKVSGVNINDVKQGRVGDCYLMAALGSIALHNPEYLENMITDNGNGTYTVSFGGDMGDVTVDDDFAVRAGGAREGEAVYASVGDESNPELWVAIIEKAYVQGNREIEGSQVRDGTYEGIAGGHSYDAIEHITGQSDFTRGAPSTFTPESLQTALNNDQSVTAYTLFTDPDKKDRTSGGMVTNHAYVVTDVFQNKDGEWQVKVYNPWGSDSDANTAAENATDGTKVNDGYTVLSMEEFNANFSQVQVLNEPVG